jgi:hypothetical protein
MSVNRANLIGGPGKITWNGGTFFAREDVALSFEHTWEDLLTSAHGIIDKVSTDRMVKCSFRLWGAWENIAILFPTTLLNPVPGIRIFGTTDLPLVVHKKTGANERITVHNAQLTRVSDLFLGVNSPVFAADVEFTGLIKNSTNPDVADSYLTVDAAAYSDATFAKTNWSRQRFSAVWTGITGFTSFQAHKGWNLSWNLSLEPEYNSNVGTVDMILLDFMGTARCIPLESTLAQGVTAFGIQGAGKPLGGLLSANAADLTLTGASPAMSIVLKGAGLTSIKPALGKVPLLNGEHTWETTRGFAAGVAAANVTIA